MEIHYLDVKGDFCPFVYVFPEVQ